MHLGRCEDRLRSEKEVWGKRNADSASRADDTTREMHEEERARQAECIRLNTLSEEIRAALQSGMEHTEQEIAIMNQGVPDLREAAQVNVPTREECVATAPEPARR